MSQHPVPCSPGRNVTTRDPQTGAHVTRWEPCPLCHGTGTRWEHKPGS